jgi:hypothetical protein
MTNVPVTVAVALAICLGLGFLTLSYLKPGETLISGNISVPPVNKDGESEKFTTPDPAQRVAADPGTVSATQRDMRPTRAIETRRTRPPQQSSPQNRRLANDVATRGVTQPNRQAPVLSSFDDGDDKSLRLADLFEEVGG